MMLSAVPLAMDGLFNDMNSKFRSAASLESSVVFRWCIIYYTSFYNNKLLQILFALPGWIDWSVSDWHSIIKSLVYSDLSNHKSTDQVAARRSCSRWFAANGGVLLRSVPLMGRWALDGNIEWWFSLLLNVFPWNNNTAAVSQQHIITMTCQCYYVILNQSYAIHVIDFPFDVVRASCQRSVVTIDLWNERTTHWKCNVCNVLWRQESFPSPQI